ncbi:MAG: type II toxin-antitoxin system RelE/ParE family toxin [Gammaproteobacteria bacterium]|nr:type II toxin-antitoxin system RelE/ParE family toxin [Gammaproteobacteria bacterium]
MKYSYKLSLEAKEDLRRIYYYGFKNWGEEQADKYYFTFFETFDLISINPFMYQPVDHIRKGYRRCVCGVDAIYFRVEHNSVEIMTIIGHQDI